MTAARVALLVGALAGALVGACARTAHRAPAWPDAPVTLRDDADRDQAIDHLWVLPLGPERDRERVEIAAATARRISDAIEEDRPFAAASLLDQLTWMWSTDPQAVGTGLAPHAELLHRLRGMFAKSGALEPTVQTLVLLAEIEPSERTQHLAELDEILAFADELAIADNGANAGRAQPIQLLQPTALALPLPWLVDRYVALLEERQRVISTLITHQGASMEIVRAHHDILSTDRRIANVLARAGRGGEIHAHLARLKGIGSQDRELAARAEVVAEHPSADAWEQLASVLRVDEHAPDQAAALAACLTGLVTYPGDLGLLADAAGDARAIGRVDQAIALYEAALRTSAEIDPTVALRLGKLYGDRILRLATGGRPRAANEAWRGVLAFTSKVAHAHPHTVWQQAAAIAESSLGRGLASQGLVDDARHALTASLERAPSIDAYETLTELEVQIERFVPAVRWATSGLAMLGEISSGDRYRRAKLERLGADALRGAGDDKRAHDAYLDALRSWASLGDDKDLPRAVVAERSLDTGRALWWLGEHDKAAQAVMRAVDRAPDSGDLISEAVAFLIEVGRYRDAVDAYHLGLGSGGISDFTKVYMSLWLAAEARREGLPLDRVAEDYLAGRHGDTWYEMLARAATRRLSFEALRAAATTGPRRAELAFYGVVLGLDPQAITPEVRKRLLAQVIDAKIVLDAEYDLARLYLAAPTPLAAPAPGPSR